MPAFFPAGFSAVNQDKHHAFDTTLHCLPCQLQGTLSIGLTKFKQWVNRILIHHMHTRCKMYHRGTALQRLPPFSVRAQCLNLKGIGFTRWCPAGFNHHSPQTLELATNTLTNKASCTSYQNTLNIHLDHTVRLM